MIPQASHKNAFVVTLDALKKVVSPQVFYKTAFVNTLVAFVKKNSQCQWPLPSHENRIGFIRLVVCFDLLGPKFLMSARQLKKEGW